MPPETPFSLPILQLNKTKGDKEGSQGLISSTSHEDGKLRVAEIVQ